MHDTSIAYMHVVPFLLTNIVCQSYVTEHTRHQNRHQNPNHVMMHEEAHQIQHHRIYIFTHQ
jgi:hypothetical protein